MEHFRLAIFVGLIVLSVAACSSPGPDPKDRFATVITHIAPRKADTFPLHLSSIDGRRISRGPSSFSSPSRHHRLSPGRHQIEGLMVTQERYPTGFNRQERRVLPLIANFEAGRRYYLAIEPSRGNSRDWEVVIWKIEDTEQGLLDDN